MCSPSLHRFDSRLLSELLVVSRFLSTCDDRTLDEEFQKIIDEYRSIGLFIVFTIQNVYLNKDLIKRQEAVDRLGGEVQSCSYRLTMATNSLMKFSFVQFRWQNKDHKGQHRWNKGDEVSTEKEPWRTS